MDLEELLRLNVYFGELKGYISNDVAQKAKEGDLDALATIAEVYWNGVGNNDIQVDRYASVNLLHYCCSKGNARAEADLAVVKLSGEFGSRDFDDAVRLLKQSASKGCKFAEEKLQQLNIPYQINNNNSSQECNKPNKDVDNQQLNNEVGNQELIQDDDEWIYLSNGGRRKKGWPAGVTVY